MMHLLYWLMFILLHRPLFNRKARIVYSSEREIDHKKLCKRAAENILGILQAWRKLYTLRYVPVTLFQAVFSAGTVFLLLGGTSLVKVELCIQYLNEIGKSWRCATNIGAILQHLLEDQEGGKGKGKADEVANKQNEGSPESFDIPKTLDGFFQRYQQSQRQQWSSESNAEEDKSPRSKPPPPGGNNNNNGFNPNQLALLATSAALIYAFSGSSSSSSRLRRSRAREAETAQWKLRPWREKDH